MELEGQPSQKHSCATPQRTTVEEQLGAEEWEWRVQRLLKFAPPQTTFAESAKVLEANDGHIGEAIPAIGGEWCLTSGSDSDNGYASDWGSDQGGTGCTGCTNPDCGKIIGETIDPQWWDTRFSEDIEEDTTTEWLMSFPSCGHLLLPHLDLNASTLVIGCGNCNFSAELYSAGVQRQLNMDISRVVIEHMKAKHTGAQWEGMTWEVADATKMHYADGSFDQVVDKSLLDCMFFCDKQEEAGCIPAMVDEIYRVVKPGGTAVFVTKQTPDAIVEQLGGEGCSATRWRGLAWRVTEVPIYVPFADEHGLINDFCKGVLDPKDFAEDEKEFGLAIRYIYVCVKDLSAASGAGPQSGSVTQNETPPRADAGQQ